MDNNISKEEPQGGKGKEWRGGRKCGAGSLLLRLRRALTLRVDVRLPFTVVWQAVIFGPEDTPWEGGTFQLMLEFNEEYPNKPPKVRFVTKMFHPNIYNDGQICLDILQNQWSPIYDISAILTSIQSLLCDPNPNSPANSEAAGLFQSNKREYDRRVRDIVEQSWVEAGDMEQDDDDDEEEEEEEEEEDQEGDDAGEDGEDVQGAGANR